MHCEQKGDRATLHVTDILLLASCLFSETGKCAILWQCLATVAVSQIWSNRAELNSSGLEESETDIRKSLCMKLSAKYNDLCCCHKEKELKHTLACNDEFLIKDCAKPAMIY